MSLFFSWDRSQFVSNETIQTNKQKIKNKSQNTEEIRSLYAFVYMCGVVSYQVGSLIQFLSFGSIADLCLSFCNKQEVKARKKLEEVRETKREILQTWSN